MRRGLRPPLPAVAAVLALGLAMGARASAQEPDSTAIQGILRIMDSRGRMLRATRLGLPGGSMVGAEPPLAKQMDPLPSEARATLEQVQALREAGQPAEAARMLAPLEQSQPHHPLVLRERAALMLAREDFAAAERLARAERTAHHDSLLLAPALVTALERQGKGRDAAAVAIEAWASTPLAGPWARASVERLLAADPRGIREALKRSSMRLPQRNDLALGAAALLWRSGDVPAAVEWLASRDQPAATTMPLRITFAEERLRGPAADSLAACRALVSLAGDRRYTPEQRLGVARRALEVAGTRAPQQASALSAAITDIPGEQWGSDLALGIARALRASGDASSARRLLAGAGSGGAAEPAVALERALDVLREGPPERAVSALAALAAQSPEAAFPLAEALFFSGMADSALAVYQRIADDPRGASAGAALERVYLIEDADPKSALPAFGRLAWEEWRGEPKRAQAIAESLWTALPRGSLWAEDAVRLSALRERAGDFKGALVPVLALADSLPDDRLAPVARQRAGDIYLDRLKDERAALAAYEDCLARYPRAWNAAEVRRRVETLRRDRRF